MPIRIPDNLPTMEILTKENIFVMAEERATHQDIRPLELVILNLMPSKIVTETQLLRLLGNNSLQVNLTLLHPQTHIAKNTPAEHLLTFYKTFDCIKDRKFDGMIITGAPVEQKEFTEVDFWEELKEIMDWAEDNVFCTMYICWGAQAGLYHHYGVPKYPLPQKMFGVYKHGINKQYVKLLRGFDDEFFAPHSRYTEVRHADIAKVKELEILAESSEAGVYIVVSKDNKKIFITGHSEYDPQTLHEEYCRDVQKGLSINVPENYYPSNDPQQEPLVKWRSHANLLFANFLNYYVYQETPFNLSELKRESVIGNR